MHTNFIYTHMLLSVIASITVHQCIGKSQRCKWSCICASMHVYMCACMYNVTHARWALPSLSSLLPLLPLLTTLSSLAINPSVSPATYTTLYSQPASQPALTLCHASCFSVAIRCQRATWLIQCIYMRTLTLIIVILCAFLSPIHLYICTSKYVYIAFTKNNNIPTTFAAPVYLTSDLIILNSLNAPLHSVMFMSTEL